jgi:hypothetical protein
MAFMYMGAQNMRLSDRPVKDVRAILWQDNPRGGGQARFFFVRPVEQNRYHLRIKVGAVTTTDREGLLRREVINAGRMMGVEVSDTHWHEVDRLLTTA